METTGPVGAPTLKRGTLFFTHFHADKLAFSDQTFVQYGVSDRLQLGFGYLWPFGSAQARQRGGVWRPLVNYALVTETAIRPSLMTGLMQDSLQGGRQGYFLTLGKSLPKLLPAPLSVYAGSARITSEARYRFVAGGNLKLRPAVNLSVQYNGLDPTYGIGVRLGSLKTLPVHFSVLAVNGKSFGSATAFRFRLRPPE